MRFLIRVVVLVTVVVLTKAFMTGLTQGQFDGICGSWRRRPTCGQVGGPVQESVALRLGLGPGQLACQCEQLQPGDEVGADRGELSPGATTRSSFAPVTGARCWSKSW